MDDAFITRPTVTQSATVHLVNRPIPQPKTGANNKENLIRQVTNIKIKFSHLKKSTIYKISKLVSVSFWHKPKEHQNSIGWRHNEETDSSSLLVPCHFDTRTARNGNNLKCASNREETNDKYKVIKKRQQTAEATVTKFVCPLDHILDAKGQCRPVSCYAIAAANCGPSYHLIYDAKNDRENWCRQREFIFIRNHQ